jgi:cytochrome P450 family 9
MIFFHRIVGFFHFRTPFFMLRDPELIKQIGIKDFDNYTDHQSFQGNSLNDLFGNSLVGLTGAKWRDMRATLSPVFTGSKMRNMFSLISKCGENMVSSFQLEAKEKGPQVHEMKSLFTRFTSDVVATSAFGIEVNSFKDRDNLVYKLGTTIADFSSAKMGLKLLGFFIVPWLMDFLNISFLDGEASKFFTEVIRKNFETRERDKIVRNDVIQLLMQIRKGQLGQQQDEKSEDAGFATVEESDVGKKTVKREWTEIELISQCFIFFLAGFDTSSMILSFVAYELALNPDIQKRLYEEIADVNRQLNGGPLTYDALQKMSYMDMVISEGLRKWPPAVVTDRVSTRNCTLQVDDKTIKLEKGVNFWIPIYPIHHDAKYYPDPEKFDPERFSDENKHNIVPYSYLPFGIGPRNCIGEYIENNHSLGID